MAEIGTFCGVVETVTPWQPLTADRVGEDVAITAREWNSPAHLRTFLKRTSIGRVGTPDGHWLDLTVSDTPYSNTHLMLVLSSEEMISRQDWNEGIIIHNCSEEARRLYWLAGIRSLIAMQDSADPGDLVMFTENTCCRVTDHQDRLPRSIGLVHGHVTKFTRDSLDRNEGGLSDVSGLKAERTLWKEIAEPFVRTINEGMSTKSPNARAFEVCANRIPHGYAQKIYGVSSADLSLRLDELLYDHHDIYTSVVQGVKATKPQPSYRTYIQRIDGGLSVAISPILNSHAGSINAADIDLRRIHDTHTDIENRRANDSQTFAPIVSSLRSEIT